MIDLKKIPAWAIIAFCTGTFFVMNLLTPMIGDDYAYSFIWDGSQNGNLQNNIGRLERLQTIGDIFVSQWSHYFTWGGRTVAHVFVQLFCLTGKLFFDFMNALIYMLLAMIIYLLAKGEFDTDNLNGKTFLWIFLALWFCLPEFFQTSLWLTGACNYLWMSVVQLIFLVPFVLRYWHKNFWSDSSIDKKILMSFLGLIAGWSNESGGAMIIMLTFLAIIYFWRQKQFEQWMTIGFVSLIIGYALMMFAPGNVNRYIVDATEDTVKLFSLQMFIDNFQDGMKETLLGDSILYLTILAYFIRGKKSPETTRFILAFTAAAILLPCVLMFAPEFPARASFLSSIFALIASIVALENTRIYLSPKIISAALIVWLVSIVYAVGIDGAIYLQAKERYKYIDEHKFDRLVVVEPLKVPAVTNEIYWAWTLDDYSRFYGDLTPYRDKLNNRNITYAQYYGLNEIVVNEDSWKKLPQFTLY